MENEKNPKNELEMREALLQAPRANCNCNCGVVQQLPGKYLFPARSFSPSHWASLSRDLFELLWEILWVLASPQINSNRVASFSLLFARRAARNWTPGANPLGHEAQVKCRRRLSTGLGGRHQWVNWLKRNSSAVFVAKQLAREQHVAETWLVRRNAAGIYLGRIKKVKNLKIIIWKIYKMNRQNNTNFL